MVQVNGPKITKDRLYSVFFHVKKVDLHHVIVRLLTVAFLSASQLHEAGAKFKVSSSKCLLDIKFDLKIEVLEIPCLELDDETEVVIRNIMASEQSLYRENIVVIRDYSIFLDYLINTTKDIDLLFEKGIVANYLGNNKAATSFVNNLNTYIYPPSSDSNHIQIHKDLNAFYEKPSHRWKATLRHQIYNGSKFHILFYF